MRDASATYDLPASSRLVVGTTTTTTHTTKSFLERGGRLRRRIALGLLVSVACSTIGNLLLFRGATSHPPQLFRTVTSTSSTTSAVDADAVFLDHRNTPQPSVLRSHSTLTSTSDSQVNDHVVKNDDSMEVAFEIIVLTMNRAASLSRLLTSLEQADYGHDRVRLTIQIDRLPSPPVRRTSSRIGVPSTKTATTTTATTTTAQKEADAVVAVAESFVFTHGPKIVQLASTHRGLRASWLQAWQPQTNNDTTTTRAIILEDDLQVSPLWYQYVQTAWQRYGHRTDLNGISLNRQVLIPVKTVPRPFEIVNHHEPFFFPLVGSQGFAPHPVVWRQFLDFCAQQSLDTFDAHVPGLITSDWYRKLPKHSMWTQLFIYFCSNYRQYHPDTTPQNNNNNNSNNSTATPALYTLYVNLPNRQALVTHWREKGAHFAKTVGPDLLARTIPGWDPHNNNNNDSWFPANPIQYGWDGRRVDGVVDNHHNRNSHWFPGHSVKYKRNGGLRTNMVTVNKNKNRDPAVVRSPLLRFLFGQPVAGT